MAIFGRFTQRAQQAVAFAQQAAVTLKQHYVGTEHILLGLLKEPGPVMAGLLPDHINYENVLEKVRELVGEGDTPVSGMLELTPRSKKILEGSIVESRKFKHAFVGTEHFWLALLHEGEGVALSLLREMGVDTDDLANRLTEALQNIQPDAMDEAENMVHDELVHFSGFDFPCVDEGFGSDQPVDVVVRPEDIMLVGEDIGQISGIVQSVLFKGVHYEMMINTGETTFKVHSTVMQPQGSRVGINIVPFNIHIMKPMPPDPCIEGGAEEE